MEKRVTIKDIARETGLSVGAVHCALTGKAGVSDVTRERVIEVSKSLGYRPNSAAASLARKSLRIAACFLSEEGEGRYYFAFIWDGIKSYFKNLIDLNVELVLRPFTQGGQNAELIALMDEPIDGLLTSGYGGEGEPPLLAPFIERGIPVALIGSDEPESGRLCCVQSNYPVIGSVMAELIDRETPCGAGVLMLTGDPHDPSHYLVVEGFERYGGDIRLVKLPSVNSNESTLSLVKELLSSDSVCACCAVNAKSSVLLGRALTESGRAGKLIAVGSDLFSQTMELLKSGVFTNLFHKKPYSQAYTASKYLTDYLLRGERPTRELVYVGNELIFLSNLEMYDNGQYRLIR